MIKLMVVSPVFYPNVSHYKYFFDSCLKLNYDLMLYGLHEPFSGLRDAKIIELAKTIKLLETELVLVCDSADVLLVKREDELIAKFEEARCLILMAAEKQCYPQRLMDTWYPPSKTPWRYLNSGAYMGAKENILAMLEAAYDLKPNPRNLYRSRDWQDDQFLLSQLYIQEYNITLDTQCKVFQCVGDITEEEYANSDPCLYHFNGHAKGIEKQYTKRFGAQHVA